MKNRAFNAFLKDIIDYAGMFPPANLDSKTAFLNYLKYITDDNNLLVSRFVAKLNTLDEIDTEGNTLMDIYNSYTMPSWISFSVLLTGGKDYKEFLANLKKDLGKIRKFSDSHVEKAAVEVFEVKLPENPNSHLKKMLNESIELLNDTGFYRTKIFIEPPINEHYENIFQRLTETMAEVNHKHGFFGFKLRTGGIIKELVPTCEQISFAIKKTTECKISFKATAGLHHPVRHFNDSIDAKMHGFFNIFGAGILSYKHSLSYKEILDIIKDENSGSFKFDDENFYWNEINCDLPVITKAREDYMTSFGSCSVEEPIEDLKSLGYDF